MAHIKLPISCSIESSLIKCGALKLTSSKVVTVEVEPIRMRRIKRTNSGEMKVKIQEKEFRGNITDTEMFMTTTKNITRNILGKIYLDLTKFD